MTDTAPEIDYITNIWTDVARDDRRTRNMLNLLRNGHPGSRPPAADDAPPYGDPTGEWAITNDGAARLQDMYADAIAHIAAYLEVAESIRARMAPIAVAPAEVTDPDDWCKNCLEHAQVCAPRTKNGGLYCKWCTSIRQTYGWLPPANVVKMYHERGDKTEVARALQEHKKRRK